jgi:hypothetical protein
MTAPARLSLPELTAALENPAPARKPCPTSKTAPLPGVQAKIKPEPLTTEVPPAKPKVSPKPTQPPISTPVAIGVQAIAEEELLPAQVMETEAPVSISTPVTLRPARRFEAKQEEMSFEGPPRGRFEKTHETMYRGENLDQPTYRRRGLKIKV